MRGAFLDTHTLGTTDLDFSGLASTLPHWDFYPLTEPDDIVKRLASIDIAITNKVPLSAEIIRQATSLRCICSAATGYDPIAIAVAKEKGIVVCNVVNYSTPSVVQHTLGLIINLASRISDYQAKVASGAWVVSKQFCLQDYPTFELQNKTLGIVGYGAIGQGVATVAKALGMKVLVAASSRRAPVQGECPLAELLPQVEVLSLHCPLNSNTFQMIGKDEIARMKKGAFLINTSRGGLVDEKALADALLSGHLGGAAVDVLSKEPPLATNPLLQSLPNLIVTPHVAWSTREARQRLIDSLTTNIQAYLAGKPIHVVN